MTRIKLCGLSRPTDIETVNRLRPDYIGFVFAPGSKRYVSPAQAAALRADLDSHITPVGVFVNEDLTQVAALLNNGVIDMAQLHGGEDAAYIQALRALTDRPLIQAFRISSKKDLQAAEKSTADHILLDAGAGDGRIFDWRWLNDFTRPYFLAGGLTLDNVREAILNYRPFGVDISSGIETDGRKDSKKMEEFVRAVERQGNI